MDSERIVLDRRVTSLGEIQLQQRQTPDGAVALEIIVNGVFLMASYNQASEWALAELALPEGATDRRVLIGGLGMGHTLRAVLDCGSVSWVDVVEVEQAVIGWNRLYLSDQSACLDDPRVHLTHADFALYLESAGPRYHAICLDVDNGPAWLSTDRNRTIYHLAGLRRLKELLLDGGFLTVWSAATAPRFMTRLRRVFGNAESVRVAERDPWGRERSALIYRAERRSPASGDC
jgi:spermidine synthase